MYTTMHIAHTFSSLQTYGKMISRNTTTQNRAVVPLWNTKDQLLVRKNTLSLTIVSACNISIYEHLVIC